MEEKFINVAELSALLGIHVNSIYNYIKKGMPCINAGKKYLFKYSEVIEWMKKK